MRQEVGNRLNEFPSEQVTEPGTFCLGLWDGLELTRNLKFKVRKLFCELTTQTLPGPIES